MKRITLLLLFVVSLFAAYADHPAGGSIRYECIDLVAPVDSYQVVLTFYLNCTGSTFPQQLFVDVISSCYDTVVAVTLDSNSIKEITPLCPGWQSPCTGGSSPTVFPVQEHVYKGLFVWEQSLFCSDISFSWSACCRSSDITGISDPGTKNFFIITPFEAPGICNSSPYFTNDPFTVVCVDEPFHYNLGAVDPDGDSLSYTYVACKTDQYTMVLYNGTGISTTFSGMPIIDPVTGHFSFTPDTVQHPLVCIRVDEFRNGVLLGSVVRDMQFLVVNCNNEPPALSGFNNSNTFDTAVCVGQPVSFDIYSEDTAGQSLVMETNVDINIPNAIWAQTTGANPGGSFSWTPTAADKGVHYFTVSVQDDECIFPLTTTQTYRIDVVDATLDVGPDLSFCYGDTVQLNAVGNVTFDQYQWSTLIGLTPLNNSSIPNPIAFPSSSTTLIVYATNGVCDAYDTIFIEVNTVDTGISVQNNALIAEESSANYKWIDCATGTILPGDTNQTFIPKVNGQYAVILSKNGCVDTSECVTVTGIGIEEVPKDRVAIYPNPASQIVTIAFAEVQEEILTSLFNAEGKLVKSLSFTNQAIIELQVEDLPKGVYLLEIRTKEGVITRKQLVE